MIVIHIVKYRLQSRHRLIEQAVTLHNGIIALRTEYEDAHNKAEYNKWYKDIYYRIAEVLKKYIVPTIQLNKISASFRKKVHLL